MMRRIEMKSIDPEQPSIVEFVDGGRYLAVVNMPQGSTLEQRKKALDAVLVAMPTGSKNAIALPFGMTFDVYEDTDAEPIIRELSPEAREVLTQMESSALAIVNRPIASECPPEVAIVDVLVKDIEAMGYSATYDREMPARSIALWAKRVRRP